MYWRKHSMRKAKQMACMQAKRAFCMPETGLDSWLIGCDTAAVNLHSISLETDNSSE